MKKYKLLIIVLVFCGNLFGQSDSIPSDYQDNWASYYTYVDGYYSLIVTDLNLKAYAPIVKQPTLTYISLKMNSPGKNGLSGQQESNTFLEIEDMLLTNLNASELDFTFVGRFSSNGFRDLYFFSDNKKMIEQRLLLVMLQQAGIKFEIGSSEDKKWENYFDFLYPLPEQIQSIQNNRVLANMQNEGDDLSKEREVFHWIYFKKESELNAFEKYALKKGFKTVSKGNVEEKVGYGFLIKISRVDKVDYDQLDKYTLELWRKADKLSGTYDGWETIIIN